MSEYDAPVRRRSQAMTRYKRPTRLGKVMTRVVAILTAVTLLMCLLNQTNQDRADRYTPSTYSSR